jgi:Protein of unknown function DUF2625
MAVTASCEHPQTGRATADGRLADGRMPGVTDRRSADDLRAASNTAWPQVEALIESSPNSVRLLSADLARRDAALVALQITSHSFLGAVVGECGALVVDQGWLRILGAGTEGLPGVHEANGLSAGPPLLLDVAWDVLGGRFAIYGGGLDASPGEVCYWGPDTLDWTPVGGGYTDFIPWALSDALADFYSALRWPEWEQEVEVLAPDQGLSLIPPPFTAEGRDLAQVSRKAVPLAELHGFYDDVADQLNAVPNGSTFELKVTD